METILQILSSIMFVGGLIIASRQLKLVPQLVIGITMIVLGTLVVLLK